MLQSISRASAPPRRAYTLIFKANMADISKHDLLKREANMPNNTVVRPRIDVPIIHRA